MKDIRAKSKRFFMIRSNKREKKHIQQMSRTENRNRNRQKLKMTDRKQKQKKTKVEDVRQKIETEKDKS